MALQIIFETLEWVWWQQWNTKSLPDHKRCSISSEWPGRPLGRGVWLVREPAGGSSWASPHTLHHYPALHHTSHYRVITRVTTRCLLMMQWPVVRPHHHPLSGAQHSHYQIGLNIAKWPIFQCCVHCCDDVWWCLCIGQSPGSLFRLPGSWKLPPSQHWHVISTSFSASTAPAGHPGANMASNDWLEDGSVTCL